MLNDQDDVEGDQEGLRSAPIFLDASEFSSIFLANACFFLAIEAKNTFPVEVYWRAHKERELLQECFCPTAVAAGVSFEVQFLLQNS